MENLEQALNSFNVNNAIGEIYLGTDFEKKDASPFIERHTLKTFHPLIVANPSNATNAVNSIASQYLGFSNVDIVVLDGNGTMKNFRKHPSVIGYVSPS